MSIVAMILAAVALLTALGVLALLALLVAGIRTEERHMTLTSTPPHPCRPAGPPPDRRRRAPSPHSTPRCRYQDTRS